MTIMLETGRLSNLRPAVGPKASCWLCAIDVDCRLAVKLKTNQTLDIETTLKAAKLNAYGCGRVES